jgi:NitT/TauT family transport system permease protein
VLPIIVVIGFFVIVVFDHLYQSFSRIRLAIAWGRIEEFPRGTAFPVAWSMTPLRRYGAWLLGFSIASVLGIPAGLWLGQKLNARHAFVPMLNFFRFLSPLAWIPFAILWFHIGDKPASSSSSWQRFFPLALATMVAVASIPSIYFRVAQDYDYKGVELLTKVTFPAVLPQIITALRVSYGISWVVIVAAEMVGCQDGLGYGIWEARNGLRLDSAVCYMIVIGLLGMGIDRLLAQLTKLRGVRWGYER